MLVEPLKCMFGTIQDMKYYIRTVFGDSELLIDGKDKEEPYQGILQGNKAGLII